LYHVLAFEFIFLIINGGERGGGGKKKGNEIDEYELNKFKNK